MTEKISAYIPAYNAEKTIMYSLEALFKQSLQPSEIIVINDCSTDQTLKILNNYKDRINIINNENNKGLGYCRNLALKISQNKFVASIDSDVIPEQDWLKKLYSRITGNHIIYCGAKLLEKNINDSIYNNWRSVHLSQNWGEKDIKNPPFIFGCNNLINKDIWLKVGGYDPNLKTNGEDVDFCRKLSEKNLTTYYESSAICYHLQDDNLKTLSMRYWRYRTYGYKIKNFSLIKFIKLSIKEIKMTLNRILIDLKKKKYNLLTLEFKIFARFVNYEFKKTINSRLI